MAIVNRCEVNKWMEHVSLYFFPATLLLLQERIGKERSGGEGRAGKEGRKQASKEGEGGGGRKGGKEKGRKNIS